MLIRATEQIFDAPASRLDMGSDLSDATIETRLSVHEAVCAERYKELQRSLTAIIRLFVTGALTLLAMMASIIGFLLVHYVIP